jgi:quercetin dioxygenase-like cupin family protein
MTATSKVVPATAGQVLSILGEQVVLKLAQPDTAGQFTLLEQFNTPGSGIPPHIHTHEDETFLVLEGRVEFNIGGDTHTLGAGDIAFAARQVPHTFRVVSDTPARMFITLTPSGIEGMFRELAQLPAGPPDLAQVAAICGRYGVSFVQ